MLNSANNKGFSLIEMIVASVILSLTVVSVCALSAKSMNSVRSNREYEIAWDLLDRQLTVIDYAGIEEFINQGQMNGYFGDEEEKATHHWNVKYEEGDYDNLYNVEVNITWGPENARKSISAMTVLNGNGSEIQQQDSEENANSNSGGAR